jgi:hypothetical protein
MIQQLIHLIKARQTDIQVSLANGTAISWESYQRMVGQYQGFQGVIDMIDNILEEDRNTD